MELKVWVEGIQRVVCGITEQTTVQEVVIALAQATGRTGRYTLVERWRDTEKLLPPSDHPIKVLEKFGEYSAEVEFLLKRTGASTTSSDAETAKGPERSVYRQSLPPLAKTREKRELLQRKEPKRKSLTITGGTTAHFGQDVKEKFNQNSNGNNNRVRTARNGSTSAGEFQKQNSMFVAPAAIGERWTTERLNDRQCKSDDSSVTGKLGTRSQHKLKEEKLTITEGVKHTKTALIPPHMQKTDAKNNTLAASAALTLFPTKSECEVVAKSPTCKNDTMIKNLNSAKKVPLMPPSNKILRNRSGSRDHDKAQQRASNHTRNSGSLTPTQFSLPNENKLVNYAYRYGSSLPRSKKKAWSVNPTISHEDKKCQMKNGTEKVALMPTVRMRAVTPTPQSHKESFHPVLRDNFQSSPAPRSTDEVKTMGEFSKLVLEQQKHIEEQQVTIAALDKEIRNTLSKMLQSEKSQNDEISLLEDKNDRLALQCDDEVNIAKELSAEDAKALDWQRDADDLQSKIRQVEESLKGYRKKVDDLAKVVNEESSMQRNKHEKRLENNRNMKARNRDEIEHINWELVTKKDEMQRLEKDCAITEKSIREKQAVLDVLNRELRQVNLQQFIRRTGSKVTVLPPSREDVEPSAVERLQQAIHQFNPSANGSESRSPLPTPTPQSTSSEGVWV